MQKKNQAITIKGTKNGLTFFIDELSSFEHILDELENKLDTSLIEQDQPVLKVTLHVGNRYLTDEMKASLVKIIEENKNFVIQDIISNVILKEEAEEWFRNLQVTTINTIIRSGQVIHIQGDVLLIGDVNPGGKISATGNIYVLGRLNGIAHAGYDGDREAIIAAAYMNPTQLRIADILSRSPDYETEGLTMEYAFIDEESDSILIDRLHRISKNRPNLGSLERRISNG